MTADIKVVALVNEEEVAAVLYYYVSKIRSHCNPEAASMWNEVADAEMRELIKKARYFTGLLDEIEEQKKQQAKREAPAVEGVPLVANGA